MSDSCFIGNIRGAAVSPDAVPVLVDSSQKLGTMSSSRRFKKEIKPMDKTSEAILAFKPVMFQYKSDAANRPQFGLIAEEVERVNPDLVVRDKEDKPYSVRYDQVNAMLLNEFLKEHRKVEEQQATITELTSVVARQQKEFQAAIAEQRREMEAHLKQQDAKIQIVSTQLEMNSPAQQTVSNNQ